MQTYTVSQNRVLGRVFFGLFGTLLAALVGVLVGTQIPTLLIGVLGIVELVMLFVAMFRQRKRAIGFPFVYAFTFISGVTLWPNIHHYAVTLGAGLVIQALGVSAGAFLIAAIVASRTSMDFSFLGGFLFIGLMALLLMGLIALFTGFSSTMNLAYSLIGIGVFIGYILFDINRIAKYGISEQAVPLVVLSLYLDFVNLFLFVLRLMGVLGSSDRR
ncbi:Bax inhibitor-1/YccA family protein [Alicyclobacillus fastidiosus]|uniref:Bax inhibitor-1/YccA family protein n=1 Tax=Alicyclobacillus fastidiosus TaxID=392011 RepID=A0ABV5AJ84_9BACL|nr:Bax inhibitor-1/YccA family protein [Alicyclobacillus fastidiosus]WEH09351.1 Bax inhibitor-1/YccA family protein [Alicyclobacillus fastidiosus]